MTVTLCVEMCRAREKAYVGLSGGSCYCFNDLPLTQFNHIDCQTDCPGNEFQYCGGDNKTSVYKLGKYVYCICDIIYVHLVL